MPPKKVQVLAVSNLRNAESKLAEIASPPKNKSSQPPPMIRSSPRFNALSPSEAEGLSVSYLVSTTKGKIKPQGEDERKRINWETDEDVYLAKCYLNVTCNSEDGTDMKGSVFEDRIYNLFLDGWASNGLEAKYGMVESRLRSPTTVKNRKKVLLAAVNRFFGMYQQVSRHKATGNVSDDNIFEAACLLYTDTYSTAKKRSTLL